MCERLRTWKTGAAGGGGNDEKGSAEGMTKGLAEGFEGTWDAVRLTVYILTTIIFRYYIFRRGFFFFVVRVPFPYAIAPIDDHDGATSGRLYILKRLKLAVACVCVFVCACSSI